jgi:hypothetical protein
MHDWEVTARASIGALHTDYVVCIDQGKASELAMLFTEDGLLESKITGRQNRGRADIEAYLVDVLRTRVDAAWSRMRHHITPGHIRFIDETHARTECYFAAYSAVSVDHWGAYSDEVVRIGDDWLFAKRSVDLIGATPGGWVASGSAHLVPSV